MLKSTSHKLHPPTLPLLGGLDEPSPDRATHQLALMKKYGDIFRISRLHKYYVINHPEYIKHVLNIHHEKYIKTDINYKGLRTVMGEGLLTNNDTEAWIKQRRQLQPLFHLHDIDNLVQTTLAVTQQRLSQWSDYATRKKYLDINHEMLDLVLSISSRVLFGEAFIAHNQEILRLVKYANTWVSNGLFLLSWLPLPQNLLFKHANRRLNNIIRQVIHQDSQQPYSNANNLLTHLLQAHQTTANLYQDEQILIDEIKTFLITGHETTGNALSWTWYCLAKNPRVMQCLQEELYRVLGDRLPTAEDLPELSYTKLIFKEALRLYPPIWLTSRKLLVDDHIGDYFIPAGSTIIICPYTIHRHPAYWSDPDAFIPERHLSEPDTSHSAAKYIYLPFGAGPRICIASAFASTQAQLIIATIAQRFEFELHPKRKVTLLPQITLKPRKGIFVRLKKQGRN